MATIELTARKASRNAHGGLSVSFDLTGAADPFPPRRIDVRTTAEALAAFDAYAVEATATGAALALSMRLKAGRAPNGFKAATEGRNFYRAVNI